MRGDVRADRTQGAGERRAGRPAARSPPLFNRIVARQLDEAADLLEAQGDNPFRVEAYRRGARTVAGLSEDVADIVARRGPEALTSLWGIGRGIAAAIVEIVATGRWSRLDRLRGDVDAVALLGVVPAIGPALAQRIHDTLDVDSLEAFECAAYDGRLRTVPGIGPRREAAIRAALASLLGARRQGPPAAVPEVSVLLDVDQEYRERAAVGELRQVAPRRFNPEGRAWLPILHCRRGEWHFTALYSNTAQAHRLQRTHDWVVLYYYDGDHREHQSTVVTETRGALKDYRVVRGRETECAVHYRAQAA